MLPEILTIIDGSFTKQNTLKRIDSLDFNESQLDKILYENIEAITSLLKSTNKIDVNSHLKFLAGKVDKYIQFHKIDLLFAEVENDTDKFIRFIIIEDKLKKNKEYRRNVLSQIIDYSSLFRKFSIDSFLEDKSMEEHRDWILDNSLYIESALRNNNVLLVVCGNKIHNNVIELLDHLAEQFDILSTIELIAIEVAFYQIDSRFIFVPFLVGELVSNQRDTIKIQVVDKLDNELNFNVSITNPQVSSKLSKEGNFATWQKLIENLKPHQQNYFNQIHDWAISENIGLVGQPRTSTFSFRLPDPRGTRNSISMFLLSKSGELIIGYIMSGFRQTRIDEEIGKNYVSKLSELFNVPVHDKYWDTLKTGVQINEVIKNLQQFSLIVEETIREIKKYCIIGSLN